MGAWAGALGSNPWSPDESQLVFSRLEGNGDVALWKVTLEGDRREERLTSPPLGAEDVYATWSPDSKSIAFARMLNGSYTLWIVPSAGGTEVPVLEDGDYDLMPAWTLDGRIVFSSFRSKALNLWEVRPDSRTPPKRLTFGKGRDYSAGVSRDHAIAYSQFDHEVDIYKVDLDARNLEQDQGTKLTSYTGENFGPRISRDGAVVYYSDRLGDFEVWLIEKTGPARNLTNNPATDRLADWSPDGKKIVFMSDREGAMRLWILDIATERVQMLTPRDQPLAQASHTAEAEGGPRWSPDNKLIAYIAPAESGSAIWVVAPDGSNPRATRIRGATSFAWYRDSRHLIYTRQAPDSSGKQQLIAADLETGDEQILRTGAIAEIAVSADGSKLSFINAVSHFTMDLFALDLRPGPNQLPIAGRERQITFGKGRWHAHAGGWAPDGKSLVYSRDRDYGDIHVIEKAR
jgi:TolB protein